MILLTFAYAGRAPCLRLACPGATALPASERYGPLAPRDCLARRSFSFPVTAERGAHSNPTAAPLRPCIPPHRTAPAATSVSPVFTPTPGIEPVPPIPSCRRAPSLRDRWTGGTRATTGLMGAQRAPTAAARGEGTLPRLRRAVGVQRALRRCLGGFQRSPHQREQRSDRRKPPSPLRACPAPRSLGPAGIPPRALRRGTRSGCRCLPPHRAVHAPISVSLVFASPLGISSIPPIAPCECEPSPRNLRTRRALTDCLPQDAVGGSRAGRVDRGGGVCRPVTLTVRTAALRRLSERLQ